MNEISVKRTPSPLENDFLQDSFKDMFEECVNVYLVRHINIIKSQLFNSQLTICY